MTTATPGPSYPEARTMEAPPHRLRLSQEMVAAGMVEVRAGPPPAGCVTWVGPYLSGPLSSSVFPR